MTMLNTVALKPIDATRNIVIFPCEITLWSLPSSPRFNTTGSSQKPL